MSTEPQQTQQPQQPQTRVRHTHAVIRCTNEGAAATALDNAYAQGHILIGHNGGGTDGNVLWLIFQKATHEVVQPAVQQPVVQPVAQPAVQQPVVQPVAQPAAPIMGTAPAPPAQAPAQPAAGGFGAVAQQ